MTWPPPNPVARLIRPKRRRAVDIDWQQAARWLGRVAMITVVVMGLAGGLRAWFL